MTIQKYNFNKQELENKYIELGTIKAVANFYQIPPTSMGWLFNQYNITHTKIFKGNFNEGFFSKENANSFYLAGFLAADGNIDKKCPRITIALAEKDLQFLENIKQLLSFNGKLSKRIAFGSKRNKKYNNTTSYALRFSSKQMVKDLEKFNMVPAKTKIYDFPNWLIDHPLVNHFMRGYFDGDGCLRIYDNQLSFSLVGNESFLKYYQSILEKQCEIHTNTIIKDRNVFVLKYCGNIIVPKICQFLYNNSAFHLDRKYNIYKDWLNT